MLHPPLIPTAQDIAQMERAKQNTPEEQAAQNAVRAMAGQDVQTQGQQAQAKENAPAMNAEAENSKQGKVTMDMDDAQRAEVLSNTTLKIAEMNTALVEQEKGNIASLSEKSMTDAKSAIKQILDRIGVFKKYRNKNVEVEFDFSKGDYKESSNIQVNKKAALSDFTKMMLSLDDVVKNAVVIDVKGDIYSDTYRHNEMLKQGITLLSAYKDGDSIVPVQLLVKEKQDGSGQLYMAVTVKK